MPSLSYPDRECPAFAGVSPRIWEELKQKFPIILTPCAVTKTGRTYYLAKDIEAALTANKLALQAAPVPHTPPINFEEMRKKRHA